MQKLDFPHSIVDTNEVDTDPDAGLYAMTDEQFEAHLAELAKADA